MRTRISMALALGLGATLAVAVREANAQGIMISERPEFIREQPFSVRNVKVSATITDGVAETAVEQTFVNNSGVDQEGTYLFPLPDGASVTSFTLRAGDRVLEGRLLGRDEARGIYESIVRRRRDPALLEYVGRGLFRSSVFPIPARGERTLALKYAEVLRQEGGVKRYGYSLSTQRFSSRPPELSSVVVRLKTAAPIRTVYSPTHDVSVRRSDDHSATASWEGRGEFADRDFTLYYSTSADDVGMSLLTYQAGDRDGYFMLIASPRYSVPKERILPKQVVFVLDRTGSMQANNKMEQGKSALHFCLDNLNPNDRFDVITFNEAPDLLQRKLVAASSDNVRKAHKFVNEVEASGGTNIDEALRAALGLLNNEEGTQRMVVFITDGLPTVGETNVDTILANVRRLNGGERTAHAGLSADRFHAPLDSSVLAKAIQARIFCFGVGYDVNAPFLDKLAEQSHADADYVRPNESIETIVSAFYAKVSSPILSNLRLSFDGAEVHDIYPKELPDLFKGSQIVISGRYRGNPGGTVRLTGFAQNRDQTFTLANAFGENAARSSLIPRIWATRKIGYLLDEVRLHANQEVIDEIIRLSKEYGVITPYTSYLADERQDAVNRPVTLGLNVLQYNEDVVMLRENKAEARRDIHSIAGEKGDAGGAEGTLRALNAKEYQKAGRAPAQSQFGAMGGRGGGGIGGGGFGGAGGMARKDFSLDYLNANGLATKNSELANAPAYKQSQSTARVQAVGGKVFYRRGNIWFDNAYPSGRKVVKIQALSDAYFQLLHARPELNRFANVGEEVVLDLGRNAVQFSREGRDKLSESELKELVSR